MSNFTGYNQHSFPNRGGHHSYGYSDECEERPQYLEKTRRGNGFQNSRGRGRPSPSQSKRVDMNEYNRLAEKQVLQSKMLSVTSRGIGVGTTHLTYVAKQYDENIRVPNIYAQFRAYLALFEAKLMNVVEHFPIVPRFADHINTHRGLNAEFLRTIIRSFSFVPTPIKRIIDAIGILKHEDKIYLPVMAASPTTEQGVIRPRPESTCFSNLRDTVVALSDPQTSLNVRTCYHENCAIPGAIWANNLLMNADEIIPADYNFEEGLRNDIMLILPYLNRLKKHAPKMVGGPLDAKMVGRNSLLLSNEMENLKCPDRNAGEDLDAYYDRCIIEGNITKYTSDCKLTAAEKIDGQINLLGEQPTLQNLMKPIYILRDSDAHAYYLPADFKSVCQIDYA
ncbi:uncharacterized protein LOC113377792 [Ctenocephalides felis]|uniref:uncharacterized protein LOC113377792 n=1 Tax=Ctenocephalides felis TaxID=7515 RepID=UPI000E6E3856|nr:uncharacterized protein LOC113377792 [Ctenocephalides felis]XP_026474002.1 uncharacterized protein LOC113377792 [Ctenocephalides felis]